MEEFKVLYERRGVCIHPSTSDVEETIVGGSLKLLKDPKSGSAFVEWNQTVSTPINADLLYDDQGWMIIESPQKGAQSSPRASTRTKPKEDAENVRYDIQFALAEVKSVRKKTPHFGYPQLTVTLTSNELMPTLHFHGGHMKEFWTYLQRFLCFEKCKHDASLFLVAESADALRQSMQSLHGDEDVPSSSTLGSGFTEVMSGFSKVTRFFKGTFGSKGHLEDKRPKNDRVADVTNPPKYEFKTDKSGFEVVQKEPGKEPLTLQKRGLPVNEEDWTSFLGSEGQVVQQESFLKKLYNGGITVASRKEAWKFLLKYYDYDSTDSECAVLRQQKREEYFTMKKQWMSMTETQVTHFFPFRERQHLIEKDVLRTDRTLELFADENGPGLKLLNDILMTYVMYNFDLGYVQGMSDLLSPILTVMEDEVDTFWCFVGLMDRMAHLFAEDQVGMKAQLKYLGLLVQFMIPDLWEYLDSRESSNLYFCFRWLLICFKREFSMDNTLVLWEVTWSDYYTRHFHLFICLAILYDCKEHIISSDLDFNDILKFINGLSGKLDVEHLLSTADALLRQFLSSKRPVPKGLEILKGNSTGRKKSIKTPDKVINWSPGSSVVAGTT